jgi:hypothetical protein
MNGTSNLGNARPIRQLFSTKQANLLQDPTYVNSSTVGRRKSNEISGYGMNQPTVTWLSAILPAYVYG